VIDELHIAAHSIRTVLANLDRDVCHFVTLGLGDQAIADETLPVNNRANHNLHLNTAQQHVVTPLIGEAILPEDSGDLTPMADVMQKDVRRDFVFAR
jgi:hypothetical protein